MVSDADEFRAQAHKLFSLTNELNVRLRVLEESRSSFTVHVKPGEVTLPPDVNIETLVFTVLVQASKAAQEDLEAVVANIKAISDAKRKLRDTLSPQERHGLDPDSVLQLLATVYGKESDDAVRKLQEEVDSLAQMGEIESLRLQMAMDRLSKMMSTLSNLTKKLSDTASAVVQNLK